MTLLGNSMLRMVDIEMTGLYREPPAEQIIRTGGDPEAGICHLGSAADAWIF